MINKITYPSKCNVLNVDYPNSARNIVSPPLQITVLGSNITLGSTKVKGLHPYTFKAGEWGTVIGVVQETPQDLPTRDCLRVRYEDGIVDIVPISDISEGIYELQD
jgi:hypothetical protein